jgi:TRAP-type mannitol/chloroaromatic compound transport system permease large subunit
MTQPALGLAMFALLALGIAASGLPVWALLVGVSGVFAVLGLALGVFDASVLSLLPARALGLLEHDLLQALPLYVLLGVLLQRLPLARAVLDCTVFGLRRLGLPSGAALLAVGAVFTPMNGSVASSGMMLRHLLPAQQGAQAVAIRAVAATLGVAIPPSLVLLLLGDAMMRAHLEALKLPTAASALAGQQIINTQTLLHAALLPALALLLLWFALSLWLNRGQAAVNTETHAPSRRQALLAALTLGGIWLMLWGIFTGVLFAVEAAASACCVLALLATAFRALRRADWAAIGWDTAQLSGALFAILLAASTFSLVLRAWGTDAWVSHALLRTGLSPLGAALLLLGITALAAWVLDAFEMMVVVIPITAPLLVAALGDAPQAAVLLLLVLQLSFLLPPLGYAVVVARPAGLALWALLRALLPYIAALAVVIAVVLCVPHSVHLWDAPASAAPAVLSEADIVKALNAAGDNTDASTPTAPIASPIAPNHAK